MPDYLGLLMRKIDCKDYAVGRVETRIERGRRMRMNVIVLQTGTHNGLLVRIRWFDLRNVTYFDHFWIAPRYLYFFHFPAVE